jgi:hypothetical protein
MAQARDAFKANSAARVHAVKESNRAGRRPLHVREPNDQNSCKKFSQIATFAQKLDCLPTKHTFSGAKKQANFPSPVFADSGFPND